MEAKTKTIEEIENLCRKADQTRSIHSMMKDRIVLINKIFLLYVAIGSAICAMFIFATVATGFQVWLGVFSASIFIVSIIPPALNFDLRILERSTAVQNWGEWVRDAKNFCNVEVHQMDTTAVAHRQKELLVDYKKVMENTVSIPDNKFNKYKRKHLQKVEISKALDKNPFKTIKEIKNELSNR